MIKVNVKGPIIPNDYAWVYEFLKMDFCTAKSVENILNSANGEDIEVHINSPGGLLDAGVEIYGMLRNYKGNVKIFIEGQACSAASVIACAGYCEIHLGSMIMAHNVQSNAQGDYKAMDKASEILKTANIAIAEAYAHKTGKNMEEVLAFMDRETWVTASQAVEFGLCDKIAENQNTNYQLTASSDFGMLSEETIAKFKNLMAKQDDQSLQNKNLAQAKLNLLKVKGKMYGLRKVHD